MRRTVKTSRIHSKAKISYGIRYKNIHKNIFSLKSAGNKNIQPRPEKQYSYKKNKECTVLNSSDFILNVAAFARF